MLTRDHDALRGKLTRAAAGDAHRACNPAIAEVEARLERDAGRRDAVDDELGRRRVGAIASDQDVGERVEAEGIVPAQLRVRSVADVNAGDDGEGRLSGSAAVLNSARTIAVNSLALEAGRTSRTRPDERRAAQRRQISTSRELERSCVHDHRGAGRRPARASAP